MINRILKDLLHDKYINKTTYDDKILLYVNDLKIDYTLHQIKDIETNFNEDYTAIEKRYNDIIEHKTYTDKQISKGIFDLVKLKKITRNESNDVSKLYDKRIYSAETHEELKAVLKDFNDYYNNMMELPEREEELSFLTNKKQEVYDYCESNLMNLYHDKYITNGFYEKLLLYYENELRSATSTLEIKKYRTVLEKYIMV